MHLMERLQKDMKIKVNTLKEIVNRLSNVDLQKDKTISIKLKDESSPAAIDSDLFEQSVASFSRDNLSFQYGIDD